VVTLTDEEVLNKHGRIIMEAFPELEVVSRCIEDQPYGIYNKESEEVAKPKVLRLVRRFEAEGFDAVIVSCAADPAVDEARRVVRIPVVGAGSAVASLALAYGRRVGVLNLTEETPEAIRRVLGPHLVAEASPRGVRNTLDLLRDWGQRAAFEALKELTARGVDVVVLGCTGYSTIEFAGRAREVAGVPVLDPVLAAGAVTLGILKQR
jgi:Asp/Glu/hydantoin racemase